LHPSTNRRKGHTDGLARTFDPGGARGRGCRAGRARAQERVRVGAGEQAGRWVGGPKQAAMAEERDALNVNVKRSHPRERGSNLASLSDRQESGNACLS